MIGIDTASVARIEKALDNESFKNRVFTAGEREYCDKKANSAQSYAGIFCAKEAFVKALKRGFGQGIMPSDIEISHDGSGAPVLVAASPDVKSLLNGRDVDVSISHDGGFAVAVVYIEDKT